MFSSTKTTSRSQLNQSFELEGDEPTNDPKLVALLDELLEQSLQLNHVADVEEDRPRKRQKRRNEDKQAEANRALPFRLVSSKFDPTPISLAPKPLIHSGTAREPEYEDTDAQAEERRLQALATAVDVPWILKESLTGPAPYPSSKSKLIEVKATLPNPPPALAVVQKSRTPSEVQLHPSKNPLLSSSLHPVPEQPYNLAVPCVRPSADPSSSSNVKVNANTKRRIRRKKSAAACQRPTPSFWYPNPRCGGKSLGYAFGYPRHLRNGRYQRDKMK